MTSQETLPSVEMARTACRPSDVRYTPASAVQVLLSSSVAPPKHCGFIEPSAGDGAIIDAMRLAGYDVMWACELRQEEYDNLKVKTSGAPVVIGDFLGMDPPALAGGVVVMNPPYSLGADFWRRCRECGAQYVAALLRCNTIGSATWADTWNQYPPTAIRALRRRPSFTGDGKTDCSEYAWFIYRESDEPMNLRSV